MPRRNTYSDTFSGQADRGIRAILQEKDNDSGEFMTRLKKVLLKVINNELTTRQKEIIVLYYFKNMDIVQIGRLLDVSPQSVSVCMKRARLKIYRCLQYNINM